MSGDAAAADRAAASRERRSDLVAMLRATGWVVANVWRTSPGVFIVFVVLSVIRSFTPLAIALVARGLINAAVVATGQSREFGPLIPWLVAGLVVGVVEAVIPFVINLVRSRLIDELNLEVTSTILRHTARLDMATLEDPAHRDAIERAHHGTEPSVAHALAELEHTVSGALQTTLLAGALIHLEPLVLFVVTPLALPYLYFQWRRTRRQHLREQMRQRQRAWSRYCSGLLTGVRQLPEIRVLGLGAHLVEQCRTMMTRLRDDSRANQTHAFVQGSAFTILTTVCLWSVFALVVGRVVQGALTVGDVAVFAAASPRLRSALERTIHALRSVMEETLRLDRTIAFLRLEPRVVSGRGPVPPVRGELTLDDVWFTYPGTTRSILSGVSLTLRRGEILGLVGLNGAGKTTLVKLITRLYDPDRGRVLLDGLDLREWPLEELRRRIAIVAQDVPRFEATPAENIAYGDWPAAATDPERIRAAARAAGADEMIRLLPQGYDTMLGRTFGEQELSGGQWQKIALARAFVRDAPLLVLDEPTSHLDAVSLAEVQRRLRELAHGRMTLVISHRAETLALADRVVVMQHGRIVKSVAPAVL